MRWMHCKSSWRFLAFWDLGSYRTAICNAKNPQISLRSLKEIGGLAADLSCSNGIDHVEDWGGNMLWRAQFLMIVKAVAAVAILVVLVLQIFERKCCWLFFLYWFGIVHSPPSAGPCCRTLCGEQRGQEPNAKVVESLSHHLALWRISIKYQVLALVDYDLRKNNHYESVLACLIIYNYI